jgi:hypothetical protein
MFNAALGAYRGFHTTSRKAMETQRAAAAIDPDAYLVRTPEGDHAMNDERVELSPTLRAALTLLSGDYTFGELLKRAGHLRATLEWHIAELLAMGLVAPGSATAAMLSRDQPISHGTIARITASMPPLQSAKIRLLRCLEMVGCGRSENLATRLLEARTWSDLVASAHDVALRMQTTLGDKAAECFFANAKDILNSPSGAAAP